MNAVEIIRRKRDGLQLSAEQIGWFIRGYTSGDVPDYQAAAFAMAIFCRGLDGAETDALVQAMLHSGDVLDLSAVPGPKVDKHSTGGVGDKISLHLAPAVAACGLVVPMISGRGLGHTGGTLDKLESIPGFTVGLTIERFVAVLRSAGLALIGQTDRLAPADKKLYALRDVTATVESIPLIAASILSKKLAEGIDGLVLDVKCGSGAFMKELKDARRLAETLVDIGRRGGKRVAALVTDMEQPLGRLVGNAAEVKESIDVLDGRGEPDLVELTLALGAEMLLVGGVSRDVDEARGKIAATLSDGSARARFEKCVVEQGGTLPAQATWLRPTDSVLGAPTSGYVTRLDAEAVGRAATLLGAGRLRKEDAIDPAVYIRLSKKVGERVEAGQPVIEWTSPAPAFAARLADARTLLESAFTVGAAPPLPRPLVLEVMR